MHELSITQQILDIAVNKASEAGAASIKRINLVIGDLSSVIGDSVQFYFDLLSKDSIAQGAQLSFKRIPFTVRCHICGTSYTPEGDVWNCPVCREWNSEIIAGNEFYLDSIEVE
jgi:hydrogenase nickel incorporation protein HypA/HybF